jgi:hypothetical protein
MMVNACASIPLQAPSITPCRYLEPFSELKHVLRRVAIPIRPRIRRFKLDKRSQLFTRPHDEMFSIAAMRVSNPDCSPAGINRCDTAPTPTGFAKIVGNYFPIVLHGMGRTR